MSTTTQRAIIIGLDGVDPKTVQRLMAQDALPNLQRVAAGGCFAPLSTTAPAQTPVAWSSFATGTNPGGHGIFDFLTRDPGACRPDLALSRFEQKSAFLPPKAVNLRGGTAFWDVLGEAGVPSVILRCPCTFPPDIVKGRMLAGMGVPDMRGGLGTGTFYTTCAEAQQQESERVHHVRFEGDVAQTVLVGPIHQKTGEDATVPLTLARHRTGLRVTIAGGEPLDLQPGAWSGWLRLKFKLGMLQTVHGMVRFLLRSVTPDLHLYASPINYDPRAPVFPISDPWDYAAQLDRADGTFHTTGMAEDHVALANGRITEEQFLAQCDTVMTEREDMLATELDRFADGLLFCLFDTPDRLQHMFWRFTDPHHPAHDPGGATFGSVIDDHYRRCDAVVGRVLDHVDDRTLLVVLSDHGFGPFYRGVHLNTWLHDNGLLVLRERVASNSGANDMLADVDWDRTRAYAVGLGGIYLNRRGREAHGIVTREEARDLGGRIARGLTGLRDPTHGRAAVRRVRTASELYRGPWTDRAPDLLVDFEPGYRVSWATPLGGVQKGWFEDNTRRWSGDHVVAPEAVPGILLANRPVTNTAPSILDLAPTVLGAFGCTPLDAMEGASLL